MRRRRRVAWVTGIVLAGTTAALPAVDVACGELSFVLSPAWWPSARAAGLAAPGVTLLAWERQLGGRLYTLVLETATTRSRATASRVAREMPRIASMAGIAGMELELREMQFLDTGGAPAYRIRGRTTIEGVALEQLQHVVPAREKAFLITFAWTGDLPGEIEGEMGTALASIRLEPEPALMDGMSAGALCALLGLLAGMGSLRRGRAV